MNKIVSKPFFAVVLFFVTIASQAKQGPPPPLPPPPPGLPIDGYIYVLLVVSLAFGIYKIYNNKTIKTSK